MSWNVRIKAGLAWLAPGVSYGLLGMLALSQWTWLELRWNTGLIWWLGTVTALLTGLISGQSLRLAWLLVADAALLVGLAAGIASLLNNLLPLFREGLGRSDLSLNTAALLLVLIVGVTHLLFLKTGIRNKESGISRT